MKLFVDTVFVVQQYTVLLTQQSHRRTVIMAVKYLRGMEAANCPGSS